MKTKQKKLNPILVVVIIIALIFIANKGNIFNMSIVSDTIERTVPASVTSGSTFNVVYTIPAELINVDMPSINIMDNVSGGCLFTTTSTNNTIIVPTTDVMVMSVLAPTVNSTCTFSGSYAVSTQTISIIDSTVNVVVPVCTSVWSCTNSSWSKTIRVGTIDNYCGTLTQTCSDTKCNATPVLTNFTKACPNHPTCKFYEKEVNYMCELNYLYFGIGIIGIAGIGFYLYKRKKKK